MQPRCSRDAAEVQPSHHLAGQLAEAQGTSEKKLVKELQKLAKKAAPKPAKAPKAPKPDKKKAAAEPEAPPAEPEPQAVQDPFDNLLHGPTPASWATATSNLVAMGFGASAVAVALAACGGDEQSKLS